MLFGLVCDFILAIIVACVILASLSSCNNLFEIYESLNYSIPCTLYTIPRIAVTCCDCILEWLSHGNIMFMWSITAQILSEPWQKTRKLIFSAYLPIYNQIPNVLGLGLVLPMCFIIAWKGKKGWRRQGWLSKRRSRRRGPGGLQGLDPLHPTLKVVPALASECLCFKMTQFW